ncbi:hypothetical protein [Marispirochaeta aestuarii]|uniref:hypothetical protein n=1 Tax=Marispirochaeta aestuarii TaxID=1963862 RepID=UPI0029C624E7|nr:hypothetical protein [Marispirochaeta aestuarii]
MIISSRLKRIIAIITLFGAATFLTAQETESPDSEPSFDFGLGIDLGAVSFQEDGESVAYQRLVLKPDFSYGKLGLGLWIPLHFRFTDSGGEIREEDWVLDDDENVLEKYLPIFSYVRYGQKGDDFYAKLGSIEDGTLGNGFIMGGYANTQFLPDTRIIGLSLDLDGGLFGFPYVGLETFVGNLALADVIGARIYARPLAGISLPLLPELQLGTTFAADRIPDAQYDFISGEPDMVQMFGVDLRQPILDKPTVSLAAFGDLVFQDEAYGGMVGAGGRLIQYILYGAQLRFLGENFVPVYFDGQYDLYREEKYAVYNGDIDIPAYAGWYGSLGFSFLQDTVVFLTSVEGGFGEPDQDIEYPQVNASLSIGEGLLPGIYFDLSYNKRYIKGLDDFSRPENTVLGADLNYKTGNALITLGYTLRHNPLSAAAGEDPWITTATLTTSVDFSF